jgi:hypothetical protein
VAQKVAAPDRRRAYGKTLYGVATSQEIEEWVRLHMAELFSSGSFPEMLELLWPLLSAHVRNDTFRKCDKPDALKTLALSWIAGVPFNLILQGLKQQEARLIWGKKFRQFSTEHVVEMCESGLAYDASLIVGAVAELAAYSSPDTTVELIARLQLFQKMLKYGLSAQAPINLYEAGFSDRALVTELNSSLNLAEESRRDVIEKVRQERDKVKAVLEKYPSYFTHVLNDVL